MQGPCRILTIHIPTGIVDTYIHIAYSLVGDGRSVSFAHDDPRVGTLYDEPSATTFSLVFDSLDAALYSS